MAYNLYTTVNTFSMAKVNTSRTSIFLNDKLIPALGDTYLVMVYGIEKYILIEYQEDDGYIVVRYDICSLSGYKKGKATKVYAVHDFCSPCREFKTIENAMASCL